MGSNEISTTTQMILGLHNQCHLESPCLPESGLRGLEPNLQNNPLSKVLNESSTKAGPRGPGSNLQSNQISKLLNRASQFVLIIRELSTPGLDLRGWRPNFQFNPVSKLLDERSIPPRWFGVSQSVSNVKEPQALEVGHRGGDPIYTVTHYPSF